MARGRFGDQKIRGYLALRRQQCPEPTEAGRSNVTSVVTRPLRKSRASLPVTLTTPRSGRNAAFMSVSRANFLRGIEELLGSLGVSWETPLPHITLEGKTLRC